jgi:hypothetical protein
VNGLYVTNAAEKTAAGREGKESSTWPAGDQQMIGPSLPKKEKVKP